MLFRRATRRIFAMMEGAAVVAMAAGLRRFSKPGASREIGAGGLEGEEIDEGWTGAEGDELGDGDGKSTRRSVDRVGQGK